MELCIYLPIDKPLREHAEPLPHVMVGDEAFPLKPYLLRPYSRNTIGGNKAKKINLVIDYQVQNE
jgi:hypothetical protein